MHIKLNMYSFRKFVQVPNFILITQKLSQKSFDKQCHKSTNINLELILYILTYVGGMVMSEIYFEMHPKKDGLMDG